MAFSYTDALCDSFLLTLRRLGVIVKKRDCDATRSVPDNSINRISTIIAGPGIVF